VRKSRRVALGAVAAVARAGGLDDVGMDRHDLNAGLHEGVHEHPRGALDGHGGAAEAGQSPNQAVQICGGVIDLEALDDGRVLVDDAHGVRLAGPVQPDEESGHGRTPASCGMTIRAGSPCGSLIDRRSRLRHLALHPVARLGLPAPRGLRVSQGPSSGQRHWQSPRGHGSRFQPSARREIHVKTCGQSGLIAEHGLPTAAFGRYVASADRPPPWTTLHRVTLALAHEAKVVQ